MIASDVDVRGVGNELQWCNKDAKKRLRREHKDSKIQWVAKHSTHDDSKEI